MQHDRDVGTGLHRRENHVPQIRFPCVFPGSRGGLQDDGTASFFGRLHDRLDLLEIVDVERGHAVTELRRMIEQLPQGNEGHGYVNSGILDF